MNTYRPPNWEKFKIAGNPLHCFAPEECTNFAYEAGADAMLDALEPLIRKVAPSSKLVDILYGGKE